MYVLKILSSADAVSSSLLAFTVGSVLLVWEVQSRHLVRVPYSMVVGPDNSHYLA